MTNAPETQSSSPVPESDKACNSNNSTATNVDAATVHPAYATNTKESADITVDVHPAALASQATKSSSATTVENKTQSAAAPVEVVGSLKNVFKHVGGKVLLTGATGFIATHILYTLLERNYNVRATVRSLHSETVETLKSLHSAAANSDRLEIVEADLLNADSWNVCVKDVDYVIHTASPFILGVAEAEVEERLIKPAVEGTLNVLKAIASNNKSNTRKIKRCVITSSIAAVAFPPNPSQPQHVYSEKDWSQADKVTAYVKSKTLAEKAAWEFVENLSGDEKFELTSINPVFVQGPVFSSKHCASHSVITQLMQRHWSPAVPSCCYWQIVSVHDVAVAHVRAMISPVAVGQRYCLSSKGVSLWEIAKILSKRFDKEGWNVATLKLPLFAFKLLCRTNPQKYKPIESRTRFIRIDCSKAEKELGMEFESADKCIIEMAESLIQHGVVKNTTELKLKAAEEAAAKKIQQEEEKKKRQEEEAERKEQKAEAAAKQQRAEEEAMQNTEEQLNQQQQEGKTATQVNNADATETQTHTDN